ncbi:MAG: recombination protein O N-terminal domain-containing protein [Muribaculum sp.]|nr:recombination protein O N-terminal domain-containing protein [Muribaculum sp.]
MKSLHCIALHTVRYNDSNNILTAFSLEEGRVSLLIPASASREARRRRAITMPMSFFECIANYRHGHSIANISDVKQSIPLPGLTGNPIKITVALFLAELLGTILRETPEDALLFDYLAYAARQLNDADSGETANFPIHFLYRLGRFLGIEPDTSTYRRGRVFDMLDGTFRDSAPLHRRFLDGSDAEAVYMLSRMSWDNYGMFRFNRDQRRRILAAIIDYYTVHYTSLTRLNSLEVMKELFD